MEHSQATSAGKGVKLTAENSINVTSIMEAAARGLVIFPQGTTGPVTGQPVAADKVKVAA